MTLHNLGAYELDAWDYEGIKNMCDEVWYSYERGAYEGSGQMLMRRGDQYDIHDMGHCSCYGPTDRMTQFIGKPLSKIAQDATTEYLGQIMPLLKAAGYQPQ